MKRIQTICLIIACVWTGVSLGAEQITEQFEVEPGQLLRVDVETGGDITVTGWDQNVVSVEAAIRGRNRDDLKVRMETFSAGVDVSVEHKRGRWGGGADVDLQIRVPRKFNLDLESMGGELKVEDVEGELAGTTMGGRLELRRLKGEIEMTTMGGDILVEDSDVDGEVTTMGGDVVLRNLVGSLDASSMGGDVLYDNVKGREGAQDEVEVSTMGGDIKVDHAPAGAGISTMGGDIRVARAGEYVKASTMGGDIEILEIDGWVEATTMGGDVEVTMIGDPAVGRRDVEISSMGGDIVLTVPASLSMDIDIELVYTKNRQGDFSITSDFDVEIEETTEWKRSKHGSPSKTISARGSVGGGKHSIKISTVNGDIRLLRGK